MGRLAARPDFPQNLWKGGRKTSQIFLSYARPDAKKARAIADALTRAGHHVWWDFELEGGSRFAKAIDQALRNANAVVVLWSSSSIESAWVQDEAAAGRDSGRLVPVLIDPVQPPLGFRQYHCIDLSDWRARASHGKIERLLSAISAASKDPSCDAPPVPKRRTRKSFSLATRELVLLVALIAILGGAFLWFRSTGASAAPSVTIAPSASAPPAPSANLSRDIAVDLGRFQTGPLSGMSVVQSAGSNGPQTDYRVEVGVTPTHLGDHADIEVLDSRRFVIWTASVDAGVNRFADLHQQASAQVGALLACAAHTNDMRPRPTGEALRLYLTGCARLPNINSDQSDDVALSSFRQLTEKSPDLAEGWAGLALLEFWSTEGAEGAEVSAIYSQAQAHLERAKALNPNVDLIYAAEARSRPFFTPRILWQSLGILDQGLKRNPDSALLYSERADVLQRMGRVQDGVESARRSVELNPLSTRASDAYISALAYSGQEDAAKRELEKAEQIWPDSTVIEQARYRFDSRYGDAARAERLVETRGNEFGLVENAASDAFIKARIFPTQVNKDKAIALDEEGYRHDPSYMFQLIQTLGTYGRVDEAFQAFKRFPIKYMVFGSDLFWRPDMRSVRADPRFIALMNAMGFLDLWKSTGVWPDFCGDPSLHYDCRKEAAKYRS